MPIFDIIKVWQEFERSSKNGSMNEIKLFRNLAHAIESNTKSAYIEETHGASKANVIFKSARYDEDRCEIADQLIISISKSRNSARATFLQAKYAKSSKWTEMSELSQLDFRAQGNQWFLLNRRPEIKGVLKFQPPSNLLSSFNNPAIGTYGVFYKLKKEYQFAYSIAEMVSCSSPTVKNPKLAINGSLTDYRIFENSSIVCMDLQCYLLSLLKFKIGALIYTNIPTHIWLLNYVKAKAMERSIDDEIMDAIDSIATDIKVHGDIHEATKDGVSLLIVLTP